MKKDFLVLLSFLAAFLARVALVTGPRKYDFLFPLIPHFVGLSDSQGLGCFCAFISVLLKVSLQFLRVLALYNIYIGTHFHNDFIFRGTLTTYGNFFVSYIQNM